MKLYTHSLLLFSTLLGLGPVAMAQTETERSVEDYSLEQQSPLLDIPPLEEGISATSFYKVQQQAWQNRIALDQADPNAWLNYYKSVRFSSYSDNSMEVDIETQHTLDQIVVQMNTLVPNTFEANYATYWNSDDKTNNIDKLEAAHRSAPSESEIYDDLIGAYEMQGNATLKHTFCNKLNDAGTIPTQVMTYNANVLNSVEPGAILITNGYDDTYPAFIQQEVNNERKDVKVVQLDLMKEKPYRDRIAAELNIPPISSKDGTAIVQALIGAKKPIYLALTLPPEIILEHQDKLYITGLALRFSEKPMDNASVLKQNWNTMELDYVKKWEPTGNKRQDDLVRNYIIPLAVLEDIYTSEGDDKKAKEIGKILDRLAGISGKQNAIKKARAIQTY